MASDEWRMASGGRQWQRFLVAATVAFALSAAVPVKAETQMTIEQLRAARETAKNRPRHLIYNNDGDDVKVGWEGPATAETLLRQRTTGLEDTQVDSLFYSTGGISFDGFRHNTSIGHVFTKTAVWKTNKIGDFIAQGTDVLEIMVDFCRTNKMEIFWSYRMNDTHDANRGHRSKRPDGTSVDYSSEIFSAWKDEHPDYLVGTQAEPPPYGRWSSVDYTHPEVRDRAFSFVQEVCANYDIDGIELDFFRHPCFFKTVADGGDATPEELGMMTDLMRRVRAMTEDVGLERGKPILVAVRTPDSPGYCRAIGLDIERWFREGWVDLWGVSGYFRLEPWENSAAVGHKYGVKVYACLSEARVYGSVPVYQILYRRALPAYRARALAAWNAGVDSICTFNMFRPRHPMLKELGDPELLGGRMDKSYMKGYRNPCKRVDLWVADGETRFLKRDLLMPTYTRTLAPGDSREFQIDQFEQFTQSGGESPPVELFLQIWVDGIQQADHLRAWIDDIPLKKQGGLSVTYLGGNEQKCKASYASSGLQNAGWLTFAVPPGRLRYGANRFRVEAAHAAPGPIELIDVVLWVDYP